MLLTLRHLCRALGIEDVNVRLNTLGDAASRAAYREALQAFLASRQDALCESCRGRLQKNPLRVLDCKRPTCQAVVAEAPDILASLTPEARAQFDRLEGLLAANGLTYVRDPKLVRGLDYYTGVIFEFTTGALGAQDAILGGGRYDNLVADLGGPPTPAVGFAAGVERLALLLSQKEAAATGPELYLIPMGPDCVAQAFALADGVRQISKSRVEVDLGGGRIKQAMRRANKIAARTALVLGADELHSGRGKLKDLKVSSETEVVLEAAALHAALAKISP
jgi:histidyl-tRNA synthetase